MYENHLQSEMREKVLITIYKLNIQLVIRYNYRLNYNFMCIYNDDQVDCRVAIPLYSTGKIKSI